VFLVSFLAVFLVIFSKKL